MAQNVVDGDTLNLERREDDVPALIRAIHSHSAVLKHVIFQGHFSYCLNKQNQSDLLQAIGSLPNLEKINMEHLYPSALKELALALQRNKPPLQEFCAWFFQQVRVQFPSEEGAASSTILDPLVTTLSSFSTLTKVELGVILDHPPLFEASLVVLFYNPRIESLRLATFQLGSAGVEIMAEALQWNTTMKSLELHGGPLETSSWLAIAIMIRRNQSLLSFELFEFEGLNEQGTIALAGALEHNNTLQKFTLEMRNDIDVAITPRGNLAMAQMLQTNQSLRSLYLEGLDDEVCLAYAAALRHNPTLQELEIRTCDFDGSVSTRGISAMADMLRHNTALERLSFACWRGLNDQGAMAMADALTHNTTLQHLILIDDDHEMTDRGHDALVQMLHVNTTLQTLDIEFNYRTKMEYYLKLNVRGIRNLQLHVNTSRAQFVNALLSHQDDLDCLFYLVLMNPSICEVSGTFALRG